MAGGRVGSGVPGSAPTGSVLNGGLLELNATLGVVGGTSTRGGVTEGVDP